MVADSRKTKAELVRELEGLRSQVEELESRLRGSLTEDVFEGVIDGMSTPVFIKDADHRYIYLNHAACSVLGKTRDEMIGKTDYDFYPDDQAERNWKRDDDAIQSNKPLIYEADRIWRGKPVRILVQKSLFTDPATGNRYVAGVIQDVTRVRESQAALTRSEEKYRFLLENLREGILVTQDAQLKYVNPSIERMSGYAVEDLLSSPIGIYLHKDDAEMVKDNYRRRLRGETPPNHYPFRFLHKSGEYRWVSNSAVRIEWEGRPAILNFLTDMTELRQAESALRSSEETLRAIFEATDDSVGLIDKNFRILALNPSAARRMGRDSADVIGKSILDLYPRKIAKEREARLDAILLGKKPVRYADKHGGAYLEHSAYPVLDADGEVSRLAFYSRDVTEQVKEKQARLESEIKFRTLFHKASDAIVLHTPHTPKRQGHFIEVNDVACERFGYSRAELLALPPEKLFNADSSHAVQRAAKNGAAGYSTYEDVVVSKDGRSCHVEINAHIFPLKGRKVILSVIRDVTRRKRMEQTLLRRDVILEAVSFAAERFLQKPDWRASIGAVMERLGMAGGICRTYLFRNEEGPGKERCMTQLFEWSVGGVTSQISNPVLQQLSYRDAGLEDLEQTLAAGRPFFGNVVDLPEPHRAVLEPQGVCSIAVVPVFAMEKWWGFLGFDECREPRDWSQSEIEALQAAASIIGNAIARDSVESALRESERKFRILAETIQDVFWLSTPDRKQVVYVSPAYEQFIGPRDDLYRDVEIYYDALHPDDVQRVRSAIPKADGELLELEYRVKCVDGKMRWAHERAFPVMDDEGNMQWLAGVTMDVTDKKASDARLRQSLEEKEILLQEIHHRVKNNLQIISSLLDMAARRISDDAASEIMRDTQSKIHSMAMIHLQLYGSEQFECINISNYAQVLTWQLGQMYNASHVEAQFDMDEITLSIDKAIPCGLVLSEVLSNVFKHAFPDKRPGTLDLSVKKGDIGNVVMRVADDGVGNDPACDAQSASMGMKLMRNIVEFQLGGTLVITTGESGTAVTIRFSADDIGGR